MSDASSNSDGDIASQSVPGPVDAETNPGPSQRASVATQAVGASPSGDLLRELAHIDDAPARAADLVGARLGRFRVKALLGRGGMGVVHRAVDETLRREVALKVLPPGFADDEERRRRFLREARSAAAVSHPSIATVYEVGEAEGRIYIAMELVRGQSLAAVLAGRRLPVPEALRIAWGILDGLGKAHEAGLVHRDLKPDNVMITDDGAVKVLDFGLAKPVDRAMSPSALEQASTVDHLTTEGRVVGTPGYMSPEQARGEAVDPRSDVFSFGVMLYEMLTGRRPFAGKTHADVAAAILRDEPVPVSKLNPDVPAELAAVVGRCLAKEAAERYGDCRTLAEDLHRVGDARARRRRWPAAVLAGTVASGALAAWLGLRHRPAPTPPPEAETVASESRATEPPIAAARASAPLPVAAPAEPTASAASARPAAAPRETLHTAAAPVPPSASASARKRRTLE